MNNQDLQKANPAISRKSNFANQIVLIIAMVGCLMAIGITFLFWVGNTIFFDDPNASYPLFCLGILAAILFEGWIFILCLKIHKRNMKSK